MATEPLSFLFRNLQKGDLGYRLGRLVKHTQADIIVLAECKYGNDELVATLQEQCEHKYHVPASLSEKVRIVTRLSKNCIIDRFNSELGHYTIRSVRVPNLPELLLCGVHFHSKVSWNEVDQALESTNMARDIARFEEETDHQHTIVLGDFNMNPFEAGLTGAQALNAVMTASLCRERIVAGKKYQRFYNPMWGFFGDQTLGPAGTHYFRSNKPTNTYWHMLDQVLLRPSLTGCLGQLRIVEEDGAESLLMNGRPDSMRGSDHLPIAFSLDLTRIEQ
ncbi:MAG: endonuclease/exonuclease/phosphatase family protein [Gemmataceae bacterium]